jgi:hypothetical protein
MRYCILGLACLLLLTTPLEAADGALFGSYWTGFKEHWVGMFQKTNGIVLATIGLGIVCIIIITRGKWKK